MSAPRIAAIDAREVLECRGLPTVQVDRPLDDGTLATADVPSGRSTGAYEVAELRDGGERFGGFGVRGAVANITGEIAAALVGEELPTQRGLDRRLIELDGKKDKSRLGGNAISASPSPPPAPPRPAPDCRSTGR
jgi:enolase